MTFPPVRSSEPSENRLHCNNTAMMECKATRQTQKAKILSENWGWSWLSDWAGRQKLLLSSNKQWVCLEEDWDKESSLTLSGWRGSFHNQSHLFFRRFYNKHQYITPNTNILDQTQTAFSNQIHQPFLSTRNPHSPTKHPLSITNIHPPSPAVFIKCH